MQTFMSNYINCMIIKSIAHAGVAHTANANRHPIRTEEIESE